MDNTIDILYYEYMQELASNNQQILECIVGSKCVDILKENGQDVIFEGNVLTSITKFIKNLFDKVIGFFKKIIDFITGKNKTTTSDGKEVKKSINLHLITKCEEKMKSFKAEDRNKFKLEHADPSKSVKHNVEEIDKIFDKHSKLLNPIMETIGNTQVFAPSHDYVERDNKTIDELSNKESIAKEDISFNNIVNILSSYKESEKRINELKGKLESSIKQMEEYKKKAENVKPTEETQKKWVDIKNYIIAATNTMVKAARANVNLELFAFNSQESILKKFVEFKSESSKSESFIDSDAEYENFLYEMYQAE